MPASFDNTTTAEEVLADHDLNGKRIVITGSSSGIGVEAARAFTMAGAEVVLAVRNVEAGHAVASAIADLTKRPAPLVERLELHSLASVRSFAERVGGSPIDVLVNNAGLMATPFEHTVEGFEMQFGVNHLAHFLLSKLLLPDLLQGAPSRVVAVSSAGHLWTGVDFDDPNFERRPYDPWMGYGQSKTANVLFAVEFTRRYGPRGVTANAVMPGRIEDTNLRRHRTAESLAIMPAVSVGPADVPGGNLPKTLAQGAATIAWAAVAPELEGKGGYYLDDCQISPAWDESKPRCGVKDYALDPDNARKLWELSEKLLASRGF